MARVEHFIALIHTGDSAEKIITGKGRSMSMTGDFLIAHLNQKLPIFPSYNRMVASTWFWGNPVNF